MTLIFPLYKGWILPIPFPRIVAIKREEIGAESGPEPKSPVLFSDDEKYETESSLQPSFVRFFKILRKFLPLAYFSGVVSNQFWVFFRGYSSDES